MTEGQLAPALFTQQSYRFRYTVSKTIQARLDVGAQGFDAQTLFLP